jgi:hypothetical protein
MQIHEITNKQIDEGLMDFAKSAAGALGRGVAAVGRGANAIASPFTAVKGAYQQGAGTSNAQLIATKAAKVWEQYVANLKATTPDPARFATLYRQALLAFVQKNFLGGQPLNTAINKQELTQIVDAISANPQQATQLFPKLVQTALASQQNINATSPLIKIISTNPPVIQYRTANYALNQQGEWANQTTKKVPDESFQAFLDQEARKAGVSI